MDHAIYNPIRGVQGICWDGLSYSMLTHELTV